MFSIRALLTFLLIANCHAFSSNRRDEPDVSSTPTFSTDELYDLTIDWLESFLFPNNTIQAGSINSTIFSDDVLGRVDATRTFTGRELNTEYIYGLFATNLSQTNPDFYTLIGNPMSYELSHWVAGGNVISFAVVVEFQVPPPSGLIPVEIDIWLTYNSDKQINQYDATFRYFQWTLDSQAQTAMAALNITDPTQFQGLLAEKLATSICSVAQSSCNGTNQQYNSTDECMSYLTTQVRFGQAYEAGMNTLLCRMIHQAMVPLRPDVHCSHIGPSGGAYCVDDRTYVGTVTQSFFTNSDFVALGYPGNGTL